MRPDEILTEVRIPTVEARSGWPFEQMALRENHVAIVEVAAQVTVDKGGSCTTARLAVAYARSQLGCASSRKLLSEKVLATVF
jgi:CO/xanthine dehydrogenase FAD-binding subunit